MKPSEIRGIGSADLHKKLNEAHEELRNMRFQQATRQLQNTARFAYVRADIARIRTILRERDLTGEAS